MRAKALRIATWVGRVAFVLGLTGALVCAVGALVVALANPYSGLSLTLLTASGISFIVMVGLGWLESLEGTR